jgi:DNA-directed RNA polymerase subunit RPC12/RpoP
MAVVRPITDEQGWRDWLQSRPPIIRELAEKYPPTLLYRMENGKGARCTLKSYHENGLVTVAVTGQYNRVLFSREVVGVDPATLVECDLPDPGEDVGDTSLEAGYSQEDIRDILIPKLREEMRGESAFQTFTCAVCGQEFKSIRDDDDALAEAHEMFGHLEMDEMQVACNQCWQKIRPDRN